MKTHDVIVIGAGAAGLTAAGGCAMFGLKALLIEKGEMGGDCLNYGCVPSKALLTAAARAAAGGSTHLGVALPTPKVDWIGVRDHIRSAIATIAPVDSQERFEEMGVEVIRDRAQFIDPRTVEAGGRRFVAPRIVIATGSRPAAPPIAGLDAIDYLTSETLWDLDELPRHLAIIGGGAIGMEMAQAFVRLGSKVTLVERFTPMPRDDREAAELVIASVRADGVDIRTDCAVERVAKDEDGVAVTLGDQTVIAASHLLVAAGRAPNIEGFGLEKAGVRTAKDGIIVDARRRTSARHIFAIGDCAQGPRFTHVSGAEGSLAVMNIALGIPGKWDDAALPWVTYTSPELGQIGLTEAAARQKWGDAVHVTQCEFAENDRAIAEADNRGFVKFVHRKTIFGKKLVGATVVGARAGDLLLPIAQLITGKASTFALGSAVIPYPNRSEILKTASFAMHETFAFSAPIKAWARLLARFRS
ncbi:MAG: FAD-dependent oxidoreductase [Parasphingorhabdus sp.]|nr:FAD-dependent oxidoreductase [Parasphingorhabdus sp.]